jgi:hypothetical protein
MLEPEESDEAETPKRGWSSVIILPLVLPVLYILSSGPVFKVFKITHTLNSTWAQKTLGFFYAPLEWLYVRNETFKDVLDAYLTWCGCR